MPIKTPKIIVSRDQQNWFDIYKPSDMMVFAGLMTNIEVPVGLPQPLFFIRIAPDGDVNDWTPPLAISVGANPKPPQQGS